jgi:hypothetical protein
VRQSDFLQAVSRALNDEMERLSTDMARGTAKDHGEYKYACGIVRGLMIANGMLKDTADKMENDEDD